MKLKLLKTMINILIVGILLGSTNFTGMAGDSTIRLNGANAKIAMVFSPGGLGDKGFNDMAYLGLQNAIITHPGITTHYTEPVDLAGIATAINNYAVDGTYDLIFGIGFMAFDGISNAAFNYPAQNFVILDSVVDEPNVHSVVFKEHEGSFLAGAMAAMVSKGDIAVLGGMDIPLINRFIEGYRQGAKYINSSIIVRHAYSPDQSNPWGDIEGGKAIAQSFIAQGSDVIYSAAGGTGMGVFQAVNETSGVYAIGVDSDQDDIVPGKILTSMMKRLDVAVENEIDDIVNDIWISGISVLGLKENGVNITEMIYTQTEANTEYETGVTRIQKIGAVSQDIITGVIIVDESRTYAAKSPIVINFSSDFGPAGFVGDGSALNPFILDGFEFSNYDGISISISNSNDHFIIRDSYFDGFGLPNSGGIDIQNSGNGTILSNILENHKQSSINTNKVKSILISNNDIRFNTGWASVMISNSEEVTIEGNQIHDNNENGIVMGYSGDNDILFNNIYQNGFPGVRIENSHNNIIENNDVHNNNENGIRLSNSANNIVRSNSITANNWAGINVEQWYNDEISKNNVITENDIFGNYEDGISLGRLSHFNNISFNNIHSNSWQGISLGVSENILILNNNIYSNQGDGIFIGSLVRNSFNNIIKENEIYQNFGHGIKAKKIGNTTISDNKIYDNVINGIDYSSTKPGGMRIRENITVSDTMPVNWQVSFVDPNSVVVQDFMDNNTIDLKVDGVSITLIFSGLYFDTDFDQYRIDVDYTTSPLSIGIHSFELTITGPDAFTSKDFVEVIAANDYKSINRIEDNVIERNDNGIILNNGNNSLIIHNTINNNNIDGLQLWNTNYTLISNNIIANHDDAIRFDGLSSWNRVENNDFLNNLINNPGVETTLLGNYFAPADSKPNHMGKLSMEHNANEDVVSGSIKFNWNLLIDSFGHGITYTLSYNTGVSSVTITIGDMTEYLFDTNVIADGSTVIFVLEAKDDIGFKVLNTTREIFIANVEHTLETPEFTSFLIDYATNITTIKWNGATDSWNHIVSYELQHTDDPTGGVFTSIATGLIAATYEWNMVDIPNGNYLVKLIANDDHGLSTSVTKSITVQHPLVVPPSDDPTDSPEEPTLPGITPFPQLPFILSLVILVAVARRIYGRKYDN